MHTNPHLNCAKLLDNLRVSGLTYILQETPFSAYLSVRKKFTREPSALISEHPPNASTPTVFPPIVSPPTASPPGNQEIYQTCTLENSELLWDLNLECETHAATKMKLSAVDVELSKIAERYKDHEDDTLTKHNQLTTDISQTHQQSCLRN